MQGTRSVWQDITTIQDLRTTCLEHAGVTIVQLSNFDRLAALSVLPPVRALQKRIFLRHAHSLRCRSNVSTLFSPTSLETASAGGLKNHSKRNNKREPRHTYVVFGITANSRLSRFSAPMVVLCSSSSCRVIECLLQIIGPRSLLHV